MSVTGLCQICQQRAAERQCPRCGSLICALHFDEDAMLCVNCAAETGRGDQSGETYQF